MPLWRGARYAQRPPTPNKYLLDDEFTDTLAAASVNGTLARPGPGTRVVVDTDGDALSVGSGALDFANQNSVAGDPGIWYDAITRVAGRMLFSYASTIGVAATFIYPVVFDNNQVGGTTTAGFLNNGGTLKALDGGNAGDLATQTTDATAYCIVLRTEGLYLYLRVGAADWKLEWIGNVDSTATLYPAIIEFSSEWSFGWVRIPADLYLPRPLAYDTFTRANGAIGTSETTGPDGAAGLAVTARTWNNRVGTTQIATNKASASALVGGIAIATVDTGTVDVVMEGTLTSAGDEVGLVLRYVDADNYIRAEHDGTNMKLIKRVATAETDVISAVVALGAGVVKVHADGTSFELFLNDAKVGATSTISDGAMQTGTEQGLFSTNVGNTQDAFLAMPRGSNGEYSDLDRWSGVNP